MVPQIKPKCKFSFKTYSAVDYSCGMGSESSDGNAANITNSSAKQDGGKHGLEGGTLTSDQQAYLAL